MKTKELIAELNRLDPEGDMDVTIGKSILWYVECLPGYWDGHYRSPIYNKNGTIVGLEIKASGSHICLNEYSESELLYNNPFAEIRYESENVKEYYEERIESIRKEALELELRLEEERKNRQCQKHTPTDT